MIMVFMSLAMVAIMVAQAVNISNKINNAEGKKGRRKIESKQNK